MYTKKQVANMPKGQKYTKYTNKYITNVKMKIESKNSEITGSCPLKQPPASRARARVGCVGLSEKKIEEKLRKGVQDCGGRALKFYSAYHTGLPDRLILLPGGRIYFVELKRPGKEPSDLQRRVIADLRALGFEAIVINSVESLNTFLETLKK